jgi:hypothetical protein
MNEPTGVPSALGVKDDPTVAELRRELDNLRSAAEQDNAARVAAEMRAATIERELRDHKSRSARAYEAIEELREQLETLRGAEPDPPKTAPPPAPCNRQSATTWPPAPESLRIAPESSAPHGRWLERALRQLARRSPPLAGRLLVVLVPGAEMDQERLVEMLAAGRLRRGRARALGEGKSFDVLGHRLATPGSMAALRLAPGLSFALAAVMIEPRWTAGSRFTLAYQLPSDGSPGPYMEIHDGLPATVTGEADPNAVSATIVCAPDLLTAVLAGERPAGTTILGDEEPLGRLQAWLERAQSD